MNLSPLRYLIFAISFLCAKSSFAQIYCPSEESFFGQVSQVSEDIYERRLDHIFRASDSDFNDSLILINSSLATIQEGRVVEKQIFDSGGMQSCRCLVKYDSDLNVIEETTFDSNDSVDTRRVYLWENNQRKKSIYYDGQNEVYSTRVQIRDTIERTEISKEVLDDHEENIFLNEYNANKQLIKTYSIDSLGNRELLASYEYDELNRMVKTDVWNFNSRYDRHFRNKYDTLNRVISRDWFERNGTQITSDSIIYDNRSNVIFEQLYDFARGHSKSHEHRYEYDEYGNWTTKVTWAIFGGQKYLRSRIIRKYEY